MGKNSEFSPSSKYETVNGCHSHGTFCTRNMVGLLTVTAKPSFAVKKAERNPKLPPHLFKKKKIKGCIQSQSPMLVIIRTDTLTLMGKTNVYPLIPMGLF